MASQIFNIVGVKRPTTAPTLRPKDVVRSEIKPTNDTNAAATTDININNNNNCTEISKRQGPKLDAGREEDNGVGLRKEALREGRGAKREG